MNHDEHLDNLLDEALSEYRDAEPLAGLEDRVLHRIAKANEEQKATWLRWAIAAACAVVVALAAWIGIARRPIETHAPDSVATAKPAEQAPAQAPAPVVRAPVVTARRASKVVLPATPTVRATEARAKPSVFPLPTPLTAQERAFVTALNQSSSAVPAASEEDKAITIAEIEIKPLSIGGISSSEDSGEKQ